MIAPSVLLQIAAHKREEIAVRRSRQPRPDWEAAGPPRPFTAALDRPQVALVAEIKQASPSRGTFTETLDPVDLARHYAAGGAACLSVLTDERFFRGSDERLREVRAAVDLPVLRKDFVLDEWQVAESRALGADAILLIAALLDPDRLREFRLAAAGMGMTALVEVHDEAELERAVASGAELVGVNNRNLHTFETSLEITERLAPLLAEWGGPFVSESGIFTRADVERASRAGACAVLVGEALVRAPDPEALARELASVPRPMR